MANEGQERNREWSVGTPDVEPGDGRYKMTDVGETTFKILEII